TRSRCRAEINSSSQQRRYRLSRLHENQLGFQTLFAEETFVPGDDIRHVQYTSRNIPYAHSGESGGFSAAPVLWSAMAVNASRSSNEQVDCLIFGIAAVPSILT